MILRCIPLKLIGISLAILITSCGPAMHYSHISKQETKTSRAVRSTENQVITGTASFYADKFQGRKTANGEIYDMNLLTAAHRDLPFGTWLEVKNLENGKSVKVRINDRGPFKPERILDLSYAAAIELDMIKRGTIPVQIIILSDKSTK